MKTLCVSLLLTLAVSAAHVSAQSGQAAPSPASTTAPLPATEPEPAGGSVAAKTGAADHDPATKQAEAEKAVLDLELKWCEAEARHEVAFLEKVEADGFTFTDSTGKLTTKQDGIAEAKQGGDKINFKLSDMKAHVYGEAAVLTGQTTLDFTDTDAASNAYRWTDVFVRQANGEWQVVASQASALTQGKAAEENGNQ